MLALERCVYGLAVLSSYVWVSAEALKADVSGTAIASVMTLISIWMLTASLKKEKSGKG